MSDGMGGAAGGAEALEQVLTRLRLEQVARSQDRDQRDRLALDRDRFNADAQVRAENAKYLNEQREASAALRNQQRADRLTTSLVPGSQLDTGAVDALKSGDLGSLIRHEASQLPSTAIAGQLAPGGVGRPMRIKGLAQTANAGHDERDVYMGTSAQQQVQQQRDELQRLVNDPNTPEQVRQYLTVAAASPNRGSLPGAMFQSPDQPVYQLGADGVLRQAGTVPRGARVTNAPRPPAGRLAAGADNPQIPRGAQQYALDIASKHGGDYNAALTEANQYLSTQQDHPSLSPQKFIAAVQSAMRRPAGARGGGQPLPRVFGGPAPAAAAGAGTVKMRAPNGQVSDVPAEQVDHFKTLGAKVVG
jgi:hypothetical protein